MDERYVSESDYNSTDRTYDEATATLTLADIMGWSEAEENYWDSRVERMLDQQEADAREYDETHYEW